jgi:hypothetical protein
VSKQVPRTPDGKPDMQGFWNTATITPLERPTSLGTRTTMTAEEARKQEAQEASFREQRSRASDPNREAPPVGGDGSQGASGNVGGYNAFWIDRGTDVVSIGGQHRTSLVVDPPDGRVPPLTAEAQKRNRAVVGTAVRPTSDQGENEAPRGVGAYDDIEMRPLAERCLMSFSSSGGPPALPVLYNNLKQIVQTPGQVVIFNEMVHDVRIVRMNSKHLPGTVRKWLGDSIGWWEGDTLVVETTNFTDKTRFRGSSENMKVTERFTRVEPNALLYQFTIEDPATWTRPWSAEYAWAASSEPPYEYACHEANYAMQGIMKGARILEADAAAGGAQNENK